LRQNPKIAFLEGRVVSGLLTDATRSQVTGVRVEAVGAERASVGEAALNADLVVDCSGRESRAPEWLKALGYDAPEEIVIDSHVGYATRFYQPSESLDLSWKTLLIQSRDGNTSRSALIYPIEHNQWMALMVAVNVPLPDTDESYLEFARSLPVPDAYDAIREAQPLSSVYRYQRTANQLRRYGSLARLPESFILIGDAVCAFNPVFGQGMSVSAMEALLLDQELRRGQDTGFALRFQKKVARLIAAPWQLATSEDARNLKAGETVGLGTRLLSLYMGHLLAMVGTDEQVGRAFFDVMHLLRHPATLFAPRVAVKILRSMLTTREPLKPRPAPQPVAESR
jgi:2-polyprenyl-6-methoxyphenol hydroxylase-like FAD-dependent oxidoreductase